jgi:hypothetical protein
MSVVLSAWLFAVLIALTVAFQLALALGAPWGHLAMGGRYPGVFPPWLRVGAVVQALLLLLMAAIVLARADVAFLGLRPLSNVGIWVVVAISAASLMMNLITPSRPERALWAPVAAVLLVSSVLVAVLGPTA